MPKTWVDPFRNSWPSSIRFPSAFPHALASRTRAMWWADHRPVVAGKTLVEVVRATECQLKQQGYVCSGLSPEQVADLQQGYPLDFQSRLVPQASGHIAACLQLPSSFATTGLASTAALAARLPQPGSFGVVTAGEP